MKTSIKRRGNILRKNGEGLTETNNGNMISVTNSYCTTIYTHKTLGIDMLGLMAISLIVPYGLLLSNMIHWEEG